MIRRDSNVILFGLKCLHTVLVLHTALSAVRAAQQSRGAASNQQLISASAVNSLLLLAPFVVFCFSVEKLVVLLVPVAVMSYWLAQLPLSNLSSKEQNDRGPAQLRPRAAT
jgi:hypothetical protein